MKIKFSYPLWGSEHLSLDSFFRKIVQAGYDGVEMNIPFNNEYTNELKRLLKQYKLSLIAQQVIHHPGLPANEYRGKMEKYLYHLASFQPEFINSHTGKDYYSFEENCMLMELAESISNKTGVKIIHETHRGRALFSTSATQNFFYKYPSLRITADFSHWCCVSESLLQDQKDFMDEAIQRSDYIHARVGNEQGPQINHPAAPEHKNALEAHLKWWKEIILNAANNDKKEFWICTEFGPEPYMQTLPYTSQPVADQFEVNNYLKRIITDNCEQ